MANDDHHAASQDIIEQFKQAVNNDDVAAAQQLLQTHSFLKANIDEPYFSFDTPAIVAAAARGSRDMVDLLLEHGANINAKSSWWAGGFGVLHHDHHELSRYLISRGAQVDPHAAAALGMLETLKRMVEEDPTVVNQRGPDGQVPLHFAAAREIIDFLLEHGADIDMKDIDHEGTPAQWAVNDPDKCNYLLEKGAKPDIFIACKLGDTALARRILEANPDAVHARVGQGEFAAVHSDGGHIYEYTVGVGARPLFLAAQLQHREMVDLLLQYSSPGQKFLLACLEADKAAAEKILAEHPHLLREMSSEEQSVIGDAAWNHQTEAVRMMLEFGIEADARRSPQSATALHLAAVKGYVDLVELLLEYNASVHELNEFGGTPLGSCIWGSMHIRDPQGDYAAVAERLIQAGAALPEKADGSEEVKQVLAKHGVPS